MLLEKVRSACLLSQMIIQPTHCISPYMTLYHAISKIRKHATLFEIDFFLEKSSLLKNYDNFIELNRNVDQFSL